MSIHTTRAMNLLRRISHPSCVKDCQSPRFLEYKGTLNMSHTGSTVDPEDVEKHSKLQNVWWLPSGPMKALHTYNSIRVPFIRDGLIEECDKTALPLKDKTILDVGCGGGLLSEPLAILGAKVTGIDASKELIEIAKEHSIANKSLKYSRPEYICTTIEEHAASHPATYDGVVCSEIIEHVNNKKLFVESCINTLKQKGRLFFTTPNRTKLAQFGVIFLAENIFQMVPRGTHDINQFITPEELQFLLERNGCYVELTHGILYNLLTNRWSWSENSSFAYALQAVKT